MVHKKYKWKNGVRYGPYYYENKRVNGRVVTKYLGSNYVGEKKKFILGMKNISFIVLGILLSVSLVYFFVGEKAFFSPGDLKTLETVLGRSGYAQGEFLEGEIRLNILKGEFIPSNSKIVIKYSGEEREMLVDSLVNLDPSNGSFYLKEIGSFGEGEGYGIAGEKETFPEIEFELLVSETLEESSGGSSDEIIDNETPEEVLNESVQEQNETIDEPEINDTEQNQTEDNSDENVGNENNAPDEEIVDPVGTPETSGNLGNGENAEIVEENNAIESTSPDSGETQGESESSPEDSSESSNDAQVSGDSTISEPSEPSLSPEGEIISGRVSRGNDFVYNFEQGQSAEIIEGSVKVNGEIVDEGLLSIGIENGQLVVSTDYSVIESGYGEEFLRESAFEININLIDLELVFEEEGSVTSELVFDNSTILEDSEVVYDISELNDTILNDTIVNETITNDTIVNETGLVQSQAVLGQPVKWEQRIGVGGESRIVVEIPRSAEKVKATKLDELGEKIEVEDLESGKIERFKDEKAEESGEEDSDNLEVPEEDILFSPEIVGGKNVDVAVPQNAEEVLIEYETPAPYAEELELENKKEVKIIGPEDVHYENVLAFTDINYLNVQNADKIKIYWKESSQYISPLQVLDRDENGIYEYIEWVVPRLSNQTFEIIVITKAEHLDEYRNFVSDIYPEVYGLDGVWSETINENEYVRVTFEIPLSNGRDITVWPRVVSGSPKIEVYEENGTELVMEFENLFDNEYNKRIFENLNGESATFDMKVLDGSLQFDHIIDPLPAGYVKGCIENGSASSTGVSCAANGGKFEDFTNATIDSCRDYTGGFATNYVRDILLNISEVPRGSGINVNVTCQSSCGTATGGSRLVLSYNNGTGWVPKITSSCNSLGLRNYTTTLAVDNRVGNHFIRCYATSNSGTSVCSSGNGITCCTEAGADNDDISFKVCALQGDVVTQGSHCCSGLIAAYNGTNLVCTSDSSCGNAPYRGNVCQNATDSYGFCVNNPAKCDTVAPAAENLTSGQADYYDSCVANSWRGCDITFDGLDFPYDPDGVCMGTNLCSTTNSTAGANSTDLTPDSYLANVSCLSSTFGCFNSTQDGNTCIRNPGRVEIYDSFSFAESPKGIVAGSANGTNSVIIDGASPCCDNDFNYIYGRNLTDITPYEGCASTFPQDGLTCINQTSFLDWDGINEEEIGISTNSTFCATGIVSKNISNSLDYLNSCAGNDGGECDPDFGLEGYNPIGICVQNECQIPPFIVEMFPSNGSVFEVGVYNITLATNITDDRGNLTTFIYATNLSSELTRSLAYQNITYAVNASERYNLTALPIDKNSIELVTLLHLDNGSAFGENQTHVFNFGSGSNFTVKGNAFPRIDGGKIAGGYSFDGNGDYLEEILAWGATNGDDSVTYSAWVKRIGNSATNYETIIQENAEFFGYSLTASCVDGLLQFSARESGTISGKADISRTIIQDGNWHLITGVYTGSEIMIYVDGILRNKTILILNVPDTFSGITIGGHSGGTSCSGATEGNQGSFNGSIDEVSIWTRPLSAGEIADLYRIGVGKYYWRTDAYDSDGNSKISSLREFYINDTKKPIVNLISLGNGTFRNSQPVYFTAEINEIGGLKNATLYLWNTTSLVGTSNVSYEDSIYEIVNITLNLPRDGTYYWNYLAYDKSGNSAFNSSNFTFVYDSTAPQVTVNFPQNTTYYSSNLPLIFNVSLNELGTVNYSLNGGMTNFTMSSSDGISFNASNSSIADGSYTFRVFAADLFGNRNSATQITFSIVNNYVTECRNLNLNNTNYFLQNDITFGGTCINITAHNVTFDGNGKTLRGDGGIGDYGVRPVGENGTIKNISVNGFNNGFHLNGVRGLTINNVTSVNNTQHGIAIISGSNNTITNSVSENNSLYGVYILTTSNNLVRNNRLINNSRGVHLESGTGNNLNGNYFERNRVGMHLGSAINVVRDSTVRDSGQTGIAFLAGNLNITNISVSGTNPAFPDVNFTSGLNNIRFVDIPHIGNYSFAGAGANITFSSSLYGEIEFLSAINGSGGNLTRDVAIGNNSVVVRSDLNSGLNRSANVTLYGIGNRSFAIPVILRDGVPCKQGVCNRFTSLIADNVSFNVTHWSNYSIGNAPLPNVEFVNPTPQNGSTLSSSSIFVNLSSNDSDQHYAFVDINRDLVLWMRFDDVNTAGHPLDLSNYSNNGSLQGNSLINDSGMFGKGLILDGAGDYVHVPFSQSLNFSLGNNKTTGFSWGTWANSRVSSQLAQTFAMRTSLDGFGIYASGTSFGCNVNNLTNSNFDVPGTSSVFMGQWKFHLCVMNSTGVTYYLDGNVFSSRNFDGTAEDGVQNLFIGREGGTNRDFNGSIDEVFIFNRSLNAQEVKALFNATSDKYFNNFTNLSEGTYKIRGYAVGLYGNKNQTEERTITIDITNITSCKILDKVNTVYTIVGNINHFGTGACINVTADNVTLNGNGFRITGDGSGNSYGVYALNRINISIKNSNISGFDTGLYFERTNSSFVFNNTLNNNGGIGAYFLSTKNNSLEGNLFYDHQSNAIFLSSDFGSIIYNNVMINTAGSSVALSLTNRTYVNGNRIVNASGAFHIITSNGNQFVNNSALKSDYGFYLIEGSSNNSIWSNLINISSSYAFNLEDSQNNYFANSTIIGSGHDAIYYTGSSSGNTFSNISILGTNSSHRDLNIQLSDNNYNIILENMPHIGNYSFNPTFGNRLMFKDTRFGEIIFSTQVMGSGNNLTSDIKILNNSAEVRSDYNSGLNRSANVTLYGIGYRGFAVPAVLRNGVNCGGICNNFTSLTAPEVKFSVNYWTNYSIGEGNRLSNISLQINSTDGSNRTKQDLNCFGILLDSDNDRINVSIRWYNNSALYLSSDHNLSYMNGTLFNAVLGNGNTTKGEAWSCSARLFDGKAYSDWINSTSLTILNSPPNVSLIDPPNENMTIDRTPNFTWSVVDDDNDPASSEFNLTCYPGCSIDNRFKIVAGTGNVSYKIDGDLRYLLDNGFYYNWSVRANDSQLFSQWSGDRRINIQAFVAINFTRDIVEFGNIIEGSNDTSDDLPLPFAVENIGNVFVNTTIRASDLWNSIKNPNSYYQFKVDNKSGEEGAFIWLNSVTSYMNMPNFTSPLLAISTLNYTTDRDEAEIDINITVPFTEGPGVRNSTVILTAELGE